MTVQVAIYGAGQLGKGVSGVLCGDNGVEVLGPFGRSERSPALNSGADVVVVATTSFLAEVAPDIEEAVESGSNVIASAEEAAHPWAISPNIAQAIDEKARTQGVTVIGCGLNPGFAFDALVVTAASPAAFVEAIRVRRIVDISRFGEAVLRRLGIGYAPDEFRGRSAIRAHSGPHRIPAVNANRS